MKGDYEEFHALGRRKNKANQTQFRLAPRPALGVENPIWKNKANLCRHELAQSLNWKEVMAIWRPAGHKKTKPNKPNLELLRAGCQENCVRLDWSDAIHKESRIHRRRPGAR